MTYKDKRGRPKKKIESEEEFNEDDLADSDSGPKFEEESVSVNS